MAVPFSTWFFGGVSALFLVRGLWNPHRAVVHEGGVTECPGPAPGGCQDTLAIESPEGAPVYSTGPGTVVFVGDRFVHVQLSNEPVVVHYFGVTPDVAVGQHVGRGQQLGITRSDGPLEFGVTRLEPANGGTALVSVEPASWLAARGFSLTVKKLAAGQNLWCAGGRHVTVPKAAHTTCALQTPDKSNFALLPVSITEQ